MLLETGASDYVTKPFSPRELLARVRAALRRSAQVNVEDVFGFDDVTVSFSKMELMRGSQPISLTCREFKILKFMMQNPELLISRKELLSEVWGTRIIRARGPLTTICSSCGRNWRETLRILYISKPSTASVTSSCAKTAAELRMESQTADTHGHFINLLTRGNPRRPGLHHS